jgi:hypothetical protein
MTAFDLPTARFRLFCFPHVPTPTPIVNFLKDAQLPACLFDPRTIVSPLQIEVAVLNALSLQAQGRMEARTLYLEVLRCLSPDARLAGAMRHLAITAETTAVLALTFEDALPEVPGLAGAVPADEFFAQWQPDIALIRRVYSVTDEMLAVYSYEQIVATTLTIAASDLIRVRGL